MNMALPLVSCIIPSSKKKSHLTAAIQNFLSQDYANCELIVLIDDIADTEIIEINQPLITFYRCSLLNDISQRRDFACEKAMGTIIVHWDADAWRAKDWITKQVQFLLGTAGDICSLQTINCYNDTDGAMTTINIATDQVPLLLYTPNLSYLKSLWDKYPFQETQDQLSDYFVLPEGSKLIIHNYSLGFISLKQL